MIFLFFKSHKSIWYSKPTNYGTNIKEDWFIREFLNLELKESIISEIEIKRKLNNVFIDIYALKPNLIIEKDGSKLYEIKNKLNNLLKQNFEEKNLTINVIEITNPNSNAKILANNIRQQLEKRVPFRRAMKSAISKAKKSRIKGIKVQIAGRLNGTEIARTEWMRDGQVPLHTLKANIDYCSYRALKINFYKKLVNKTKINLLINIPVNKRKELNSYL